MPLGGAHPVGLRPGPRAIPPPPIFPLPHPIEIKGKSHNTVLWGLIPPNRCATKIRPDGNKPAGAGAGYARNGSLT